MFARVQKTTNGYVVEVPSHVAEDWQLVDGSTVELSRIIAPREQDVLTIRYATVEEALDAFRTTLPEHEDAYRELAE